MVPSRIAIGTLRSFPVPYCSGPGCHAARLCGANAPAARQAAARTIRRAVRRIRRNKTTIRSVSYTMRMEAATTPRRTQAERRAETRGRLLDATIESLGEVGYAATTVRGVADRA